MIRHADQAGLIDFSPANVLIFEFSTVNGAASSAVSFRDVSSLDHEFIYDAVED
jgi:hypothetical protein